MSQTPRLEEVMEAAIGERLQSFYTALPARVTGFNHLVGTCTIEFMVTEAKTDSKGEYYYQFGAAGNIPVLFPRSGRQGLTHPVNEGDLVLYIVSTIPLWQWMKDGTKTGYVVPQEARNHLGTGFVIPGMFTFRDDYGPIDMDATVITGRTKLGGASGTQQTIMGDTFNNALDTLLTAIKALTTALATSAPTPGTVLQQAASSTAATNATTAIQAFQSAIDSYLTVFTEVK